MTAHLLIVAAQLASSFWLRRSGHFGWALVCAAGAGGGLHGAFGGPVL